MKRMILLLMVMLFASLSLVHAENQGIEKPAQIAQDAPPVTQLEVNFGVVGGYRYMRVIGSNVAVYDAPSGNIIRRYTDGYNFVTPRNEDGDWIEINPGEWVRARDLREVYPSYFAGVLIQGEPAVPFGWILVTHYASNTPGGSEVKEQAFRVTRYTLTNLYNATNVDGWIWYDIGGGRWIKQTMVSKIQRVGNPGFSGHWVAIDLYEQNIVAYEGDRMVFASLVSTGLPGTDTNTGTFQVWAQQANKPMSGERGGYGNYRLENVPYATFFDGDISIHGTYWHNGFGYRQSRGCVNMTITDAKWVYEWLGEAGGVYVYYSQSY